MLKSTILKSWLLSVMMMVSFGVMAQVVPDDWTVSSKLNTYQESTIVAEGNHSVKIEAFDGGNSQREFINSTVIPVTGGTEIKVSSKVYHLDAQLKVRFKYVWEGATNTYSGPYSDFNTHNAWTELEDFLTVPDDATGLQIGYRVYKGSGFTEGSIVYIDDVQAFIPLGNAVPFANNNLENWPAVSTEEAVTVVTPNGGEAVEQGAAYDITWTAENFDGNVNITLVAGSEETAIASNIAAADGSYTWTVPADQAVADNYQIKIADAEDGTPEDISDANFSVVTPSIYYTGFDNLDDWGVHSEVGNETWYASEYAGRTFAKMSGYSGGNKENVDWLVSPKLDLSSYEGVKMTFESAQGYGPIALDLLVSTDYDGASDPYTFTWTPLTAEWSDENWTWKSSGDVSLNDYLQDGVYIAFKYTSTTESAGTWEIDDFTITPSTEVVVTPTLAVTAPNGGESIEQGANFDITWNAENFDGNVNITLVAAAEETVIASDIAAADGTYTWTVAADQAIADNYTIKIEGTEGNPTDVSDAAFAITAPYVTPNLVISEIMYNPPEEGTDYLEYIEIYNAGETTNLEGVTFTKGIEHTFVDYTLDAGAFVVVALDPISMTELFGVESIAWDGGNLKNSGETIEIADAKGNIIDEVAFDDANGWDKLADGPGHSLVLIDLASDNSLAESWAACPVLGGTYEDGTKVYGTPGNNNLGTVDFNFAADVTDVTVGGSVNFSIETESFFRTVNWTFEGGEPATSEEEAPAVTYATAGTYKVSLVMSNGCIENTVEKEAYITVTGGGAPVEVFYTQDFADDLGDWTAYNEVGPDQEWEQTSFFGTSYAQMSGVGSGNEANIDWLISPEFDLSIYSAVKMNFASSQSQAPLPLELLVSTDYDGNGNPTTATWTALTAEWATNNSFKQSGDVNLNDYLENGVYVAYKYTSTTEAAGIWKVNDIKFESYDNVVVPAITVTAPNGGEELVQGEDFDITWTVENFDGNVNIVLVAGTEETAIASDVDASTGTFTWTVAEDQAVADDYTVKVQSTEVGGPMDVSDAAFAVVAPVDPNIFYSEPFNEDLGEWTTYSEEGEQAWKISAHFDRTFAMMSGYAGGSNPNIDWLISPKFDLSAYEGVKMNFETARAFPGDDLQLLISTDYDGSSDPNTATWNPLEATWPETTPNFKWTESGDVSLNTFIGDNVYVAFLYQSTTISSAQWQVDNFTLAMTEATPNPAVAVLTPNGGESIEQGSTFEITWFSHDWEGNVNITLVRPEVEEDVVIAADVALADASYIWTVPADLAIADDYKVRIAGTEEGQPYDISDDVFSIIAPVISDDIYSHSFADFGGWTIFSEEGDQEWVTDFYGGRDYAKATGYTPGEKVNNPNIDWLVSPVFDLSSYEAVNMTFESAQGYTTNPLELLVSTDYDGAGDPTTATWTPLNADWAPASPNWTWTESGDVSMNDYLQAGVYVAFKYTATVEICGTWEIDNFTLTEAEVITEPVLTVETPNGGEKIEQGSTYDITWSSMNWDGNVNIILVRPEVADVVIAADVALADASYTWNVPADLAVADNYSIKIKGTEEGQPEDSSDATFEITAPYNAPVLVISEIMFNPPEEGNDILEYIELYNPTSEAVNIEGVQFAAGIEHTFGDVTIEANGFLVLALNAEAFTTAFGVEATQWDNGALKNSGELVQLVDAKGDVIDEVDYKTTAEWPALANGEGHSMILCDLASDNSLAENWKACPKFAFEGDNGKVYGNPGNNDLGTLEAKIYAYSTETVIGQEVMFENDTEGFATSIEWTFEGGTPETSNDNLASVSYAAAGTYDVTLMATNGCVTDTEVLEDAIAIYEEPAVEFTATETELEEGESTVFSIEDATISDDVVYIWTFDGADDDYDDSDPTNIEVTYSERGEFDVEVMVMFGSMLSIEFSREAYIKVGPVSVDEVNAENKFEVYPQPANHFMTIKLQKTGNYELRLLDIQGQLVKNFSNADFGKKINVSDLNAGQYIMQLINLDDNKVEVRKLIIQ